MSFTHDDGSGASFVVEAGGSITPGQAVLNQVSVSLAEQILAQPAGDKHTVSQKVTLPDGELYNVIMGAAGNIVAKHEHPSGLLGDIEEGVGLLADALTFIPGLNGVGLGLAIGLGLVEGGQELASGNVLGGVLSIAGAAAGADGAPGVGRLVAVAQGVSGVVTGAESGDIGVAIASGLGGLGAVVSVFDPGLGKLLLASSALTSVGVAASGGNVLAALGPAITAVANGADAADQMTSDSNADDPFAGPGTANAGGALPPGDDPGTAGGAGATPGGDTSAADPFAGPGVDGTAAAAALAADTTSIAKMVQDAAASTAAQAGGGTSTGAGGGGAATGGSGAAGPSGEAPAGTGQVGTGSNGAPDVSRQSGGLPTTGGGAATSGTMHVDIDPVSTSYAPAGGASATPAGLPMVAAGVAGGALAGSGGGSGLGGSVAVGGAAAESGGVGAFVSGALDVGLDVLGSAVAAPVMFFATLLTPSPLADDTLNALKPQSGGTSSGAAPGGSGAGDNPATSGTAGTSANTGNLAPMTGLDGGSGVSTTNPGFSSAPALP